MISFYKGQHNMLRSTDDEKEKLKKITEQIVQTLNAQNVSFLLGSGCSSCYRDNHEVGIPTMKPLAKKFIDEHATSLEAEFTSLSININDYSNNLEKLMEVLYAANYYFNKAIVKATEQKKAIEKIIREVKNFIVAQCGKKSLQHDESPVKKIYQNFYRKLSLRDKNLPSPWIFTTNYDVFNEIALDSIGIPFTNGFNGVIERCFNPAVFRYTLSQELGISSKKWTTVDSYIYLCKLHGSINWIEEGSGLFPIKEKQSFEDITQSENRIMIYPTPQKTSSSFSAPYSDLFREFQSRLLQEQNVLICLGYSFGDEHVNNIIFRALTIPTFRLIILADPNDISNENICKLQELNDPRIWIIGGELEVDNESSNQLHYFDNFVSKILPNSEDNEIEKSTAAVLERFLTLKTSKQNDGEVNE